MPTPPLDGPAMNDITNSNEQRQWVTSPEINEQRRLPFQINSEERLWLKWTKVLKGHLYTESQTFLSKPCQHMLDLNHRDISLGYLLIMHGLEWWNSGLRFFLFRFSQPLWLPWQLQSLVSSCFSGAYSVRDWRSHVDWDTSRPLSWCVPLSVWAHTWVFSLYTGKLRSAVRA